MELKSIHGHWGYGLFWALIERMRVATHYRLDMRLINGLALSLNEPVADLQRMLQTSEALGIFVREGEHFIFSPALRRRMEAYENKRSRCAEAGKRSAAKRNVSSTGVEQTLNERSTDAERESNDRSTYITKDNTTKDNTNELKSTDLGTNPVPEPTPPALRKKPKQELLVLPPPAAYVDPNTRTLTEAKHLRISMPEIDGLRTAFGHKLYDRCAADADDWLANNPKRLRELKDHAAFLRTLMRKEGEKAQGLSSTGQPLSKAQAKREREGAAMRRVADAFDNAIDTREQDAALLRLLGGGS